MRALLDQRLDAHLDLEAPAKAETDRWRCLPTLEMHALLGYFATHGRFADEAPSGYHPHRYPRPR